jgi:hypothetical protein
MSEDRTRELATLRAVVGILLSPTSGRCHIKKDDLKFAPRVVLTESPDAVVVTVDFTNTIVDSPRYD